MVLVAINVLLVKFALMALAKSLVSLVKRYVAVSVWTYNLTTITVANAVVDVLVVWLALAVFANALLEKRVVLVFAIICKVIAITAELVVKFAPLVSYV